MKNILMLIQARMGSSRLPQKVLTEIAEKPLIQHLWDRLKKSQFIEHSAIITTTNKEDDQLVAYCNANHIPIHRGSDWDVLDRFYQSSLNYPNSDTIVRICSDNPLHSYKVLDFVINQYLGSNVDYFSNSNHEPDYLEDGFDVEIFSKETLHTAWKNAKLLSEREHVTPYIKNSGLFKCAWKKACKDYHFKLSVDTENDRLAVEEIFKALRSIEDFSIEEVVTLLQEKPEILKINQESIINSGYLKSLKEDKEIY
ncbi:glycosyltransferase family protein [Lentisphaera profundi]|uniref:Glycosyltransferase family protein n=1 Tax=Lentisphaera profundi TaxID=1658616 RepID=A0ABY7VWN4_9BACT|nr:glycosyltransferase family protein [Lentisphaera profundi]WDE98194.1 glycosyltransferase family protein [Lentisphaera profundi]